MKYDYVIDAIRTAQLIAENERRKAGDIYFGNSDNIKSHWTDRSEQCESAIALLTAQEPIEPSGSSA